MPSYLGLSRGKKKENIHVPTYVLGMRYIFHQDFCPGILLYTVCWWFSSHESLQLYKQSRYTMPAAKNPWLHFVRPIDVLHYLLILCLPLFVTLSIGLSNGALHDAHQKQQTAKCPALDGDPDMLGIGVRVATYLQIVLTIFLNPKKAVTLAPVNLWFSCCFFCCVMYHPLDTRQWYYRVLSHYQPGKWDQWRDCGHILHSPTVN